MSAAQPAEPESFYAARVARERLGALIRRHRGDRTQSWLAAQALVRGVRLDQTAISDIETDKRKLDMGEAAVLADVLGIPKDEISLALTAEYEIARNLVVGSAKDARAIADIKTTLARRHRR